MLRRDALSLKMPQFWLTPVSDHDQARRRSQRGHILLTLAVLGFIAAVAYADSKVEEISLGYLYVLPIALSGLINRRLTTFCVIAVCIMLHDYFGPPHTLIPRLLLNLFALVAFSAVALIANRLGRERDAE